MTDCPPNLERTVAAGTAVRATEPWFAPVLTLVIWLGCVAIGTLGLVLPYARAQWAAKKAEPPPVVAQLLNVELTTEPLPPVASATLPKLLEPPPITPPVAVPEPPALAVAEPSPAIAFAVPVAAPATIVEPQQASYRTPEVMPTVVPQPAATAPRQLTFGQGEGKQPAPEYPRQALREGQEGTVLVRFTVSENGRVLAAEAPSPSAWPLLNDAALRVVRQRWRFPAGALRAYEVAIHFQINR
jgi:periplasmic protein TonB